MPCLQSFSGAIDASPTKKASQDLVEREAAKGEAAAKVS